MTPDRAEIAAEQIEDVDFHYPLTDWKFVPGEFDRLEEQDRYLLQFEG